MQHLNANDSIVSCTARLIKSLETHKGVLDDSDWTFRAELCWAFAEVSNLYVVVEIINGEVVPL